MDESFVKEIVKKVVDNISEEKTIPIETSGRHVHLSEKDMEILFGRAYKMTKKKELSQPGQFQYEERVRLIGPKGVIDRVAILGPARSKTQVEVSKTDARVLGVNPPVRESGDLNGSEDIYIATEDTMIKAEQSVIVAKRHIHMNREDAKKFNVADKQTVKVKINSDRPVIFEDITVRVNDNYNLSMHIDFDEANATGCKKDAKGEIIL
ncbi:phosphate propanoyltransferase [Dethiothermospora halolimnae]|uniref:phosphate propanoyltransferase n=1 Tax=Dethiothermospora halolimnae TaxID=3114390 RepID=UPI003CCC2B81